MAPEITGRSSHSRDVTLVEGKGAARETGAGGARTAARKTSAARTHPEVLRRVLGAHARKDAQEAQSRGAGKRADKTQ